MRADRGCLHDRLSPRRTERGPAGEPHWRKRPALCRAAECRRYRGRNGRVWTLRLVVVVAVARGVVFDGLVDQLRQARATLDQLVMDESQLGAVANAERAAERAAQYRASSLENLLRLLWLRAQHRE